MPILPFIKPVNRYIERGSGCIMYDQSGREYLDFESGDWAANLGHSHERITRRIADQAAKLIHDGMHFRNMLPEELSLRLLEKLGFENGASVFLSSGSEAVNLGITCAKNLTGRDQILKLDGTYLAAYGLGMNAATNTGLINIPFDSITALDTFDFDTIAAFVFEPGNTGGKVRFPSNELVIALGSAVKKHGGYLIANEVTTGFGRTGRFFGFEHYGVAPDIVANGKALGNGYPVSGVAVTAEVAERFSLAPFRYVQSHQNDPLGCAVGCEVFSIFEDEMIISKSVTTGAYLLERLHFLREKYPSVISDARGRGLMCALEFREQDAAQKATDALFEEGIIVGCRENVMRFMPPLIVETHQIDYLVANIDMQLAGLR